MSSKNGKKKTTKDDLVKYIILIAVTSVWTISFVAEIFKDGYSGSQLVHLLMSMVLGYYLKDKYIKK